MSNVLSRPLWVLAALLVVSLFIWNRVTVGRLNDVDRKSITDRARMHERLDSLEVRVEHLELEIGVMR